MVIRCTCIRILVFPSTATVHFVTFIMSFITARWRKTPNRLFTYLFRRIFDYVIMWMQRECHCYIASCVNHAAGSGGVSKRPALCTALSAHRTSQTAALLTFQHFALCLCSVFCSIYWMVDSVISTHLRLRRLFSSVHTCQASAVYSRVYWLQRWSKKMRRSSSSCYLPALSSIGQCCQHTTLTSGRIHLTRICRI